MDDRILAQAEIAARQLLQGFKEQHLWWTNDRTPVDELASWLGLTTATFSEDDYLPGTYGWLEPGEDLVWLRKGLPEQLRRFTLAHELGHVMLHREPGHLAQSVFNTPTLPQQSHLEISPEDPCQEVDVREEVTGLIDQQRAEELLGIGQSYDPRSQRELAANIFAAELLMPRERLKTLYLRQRIPANQLANIFDVSQAALLNRLVGLLKEPEGVPSRKVQLQPIQSPAQSSRRQYDEFQQAAIEAPTPALIVAGPGSGKTSTLIGRVDHLIHTESVLPQHILALTFSRKAAQEMQERLQQMLNEESMALPTVSTFHAFCAELLRTHGELVGLRQDFTFIDDAEGYFLLRRLAGELPLRHYQNLKAPTLHFPTLLSAISRAKDELVIPAQYKQLAERMLEQAQNDEEVQKAEKALEVAEIYALYQAGLERQGDIDFGGLIMLAVQLLQKHPGVLEEQQQKYQHILVDEFQDINRASGVLLRLLAGDARRIWVVGDANQAIYGFRGASPANIARFQDDYPGAVILPLSRNYRSRPDIVSLADAFRWKQLEQDKEQQRSSTARSSHLDTYVTLAIAKDEASELNGVLADIRQKCAQGYAYRDIVVLCRTRAHARKITRALALAELPVIEHGGMLEQEHSKDLLSIVLLLADSNGRGILRAARQPEHTLSQRDIEALLLAAREKKCPPGVLISNDDAPLSMSAEGCRSLRRLANILQTLQRTSTVWELLAQYLFIETSLARDLLCEAESEQVYANGAAWPGRDVASETSPVHLSSTISLVHAKGTTTFLADYAGMLQLARFYDQRQQVLRMQQEAPGLHGESVLPKLPIFEQAKGFLDYLNVLLTLRQDGGNRREEIESNGEEIPDAIRVMTVHASKGLEFPVVYLPGLVQRRFPMQKRAHAAPAPAGMLHPESEGESAHESGEACLFYVGATRARDHLVLSYSERYGKQNYKRSPYIDALVAGLPAERISRVIWQEAAGALSLEEVVNEQLPSSQPGESFIQAMQSPTLSASALETYQGCPRRYAYSNIYRFQTDEGAYQVFRQATKKTFEAIQVQQMQARKEQGDECPARLPNMAEAQDLYSQHWQALGGHEFPFASIYEQHGREVMELIWDKLAQAEDAAGESRQNFEVEIAGKIIRVEVDYVEKPAQTGEPTRLVRRSFGKRKEKPAASTRELLYALAYRQQHPGQSYELHDHNLSTNQKVLIKLTEKREHSLYDELEKSLQGLERHEYPPKPDPFICPTCPFFLICPA